VRLMSPEYVRPYVKAHKNDERDAEAIAEAATHRRCASSSSRPPRSSTCRRCIVHVTG
jgi:transposase